MRILITAPSLNPHRNVSGISTVVNTLINYNKQKKYFHYLLGRPDENPSQISWFILLLRQLTYFPNFLFKNKIDIVHQNIPFNYKGILRELIINFWCKIFGIPVVLHIHGGELLMKKPSYILIRMICNFLFKNSKQVIVLSKLEKKSLQEFYKYSDASVLGNCVDIKLYQKDKFLRANSKPTLLYIGRIHESKGVNEIMQALTLLKKHQDFKFILCGTGPLKNNFVKHCQKLMGSDFEFLGIVHGDLKLKVIRSADIFLLPSRYGEGLPMALLETMAAGVIPIVTDDASMKHIINNNTNGILVKKNNPTDLYNKINFLLSSPSLQMSMSSEAIETIRSNYDIENYIKELNIIYSLALA